MLASNAAMVSFEHPTLGSAAKEFIQFDAGTAMDYFSHLDKVVGGKLDHWKFAEFCRYRGIPIYSAQIGSSLMIYSVEEQGLDDRKVTVLFCGRFGTPVTAGGFKWDGHDVSELRSHLIEVRAAAWFT